ncbi:hypothetical protein OPIT5_10275 [Opitutaceae bacterium TAV5]|nr:hypothetical protein OPIT5_10275 [Opitutaceae bacterium TAV5]
MNPPAYRLLPLVALIPLSLAGGLSRSAAAALDASVSDPVEANDGWEVVTQGKFIGGTAGLAPEKGAAFFDGRNTLDTRPPATNRGAARFFKGVTVEPGLWEITLSVGKFPDLDFITNLSVTLLADTDGAGVYKWSQRIPRAPQKEERPLPPDGGWARWTCVFRIEPGAQTGGGKPAIGAPLGLLILSNTRKDTGFAFDNVEIRRVAD